MVVNTDDLIVQFDGQSTLLVRIGQHLENSVTGMCGNFNNDPADDKVYPNGTLAQNDNAFGHSWQATTSQPGWAVLRNLLNDFAASRSITWGVFCRCGSTEDPDEGLNDCPLADEYSELCSVITNTSGPFSSCHPHADPQPFFTSCVYDLCLYTPANGMLCSAISAYERGCSVLGLNISDWRSDLHCGTFPTGGIISVKREFPFTDWVFFVFFLLHLCLHRWVRPMWRAGLYRAWVVWCKGRCLWLLLWWALP